MTVYVLGAGPSGLAAAHGLVEATAADVVVIEGSATLGGLAQTVNWEGRGAHDLGPHKIFTTNAELMRRVEALLADSDWLTREKRSVIFLSGHFLPYPPSPFSLIKVFGLSTFIGMTAGYLAALVRGLFPRNEPMTFEEDLKGRVGSGLYAALFRPIAMKLWGNPSRLDVKLSRGRVQLPKLAELIHQLIGVRKKSGFEALTFRYPQGGLQRLWEAIRRRCGERGKFLLNHRVETIDVVDRRVTAIHCRGRDGAPVVLPVQEGDFVVSTLPLGLSAEIMPRAFSDETRRDCREIISLNDLLLVFFHVDTPSLLNESWVFVPDPEIAFHRVSEQESFDPGMTPRGSIVCCEIMSNESRPMSAKSNEELVELTLQGLAAMGYSDYRVLETKIIRLPKSYPVFRPGFEPKLRRVLADFDALENFRTIGRQGAFNYIGTLDAMDIGYGFVEWFKNRSGSPWEAERERTGHYPVLD